jgi:RNA polymerase sigma factor (sigma-70 family)
VVERSAAEGGRPVPLQLGKDGPGLDEHERPSPTDTADHEFARRLARAQSGDPRAFEELLQGLERPLAGFLRSRGAEDSESLANDVLVRAFRGIGRFDGGAAQFRAWVYRIARNVLVDEHRHRARRVDAVAMMPHELPDTPTAGDVLDRVGERDRVEAMLSGLTDEQREVVLLRIVAGLSVEETAQVVGRRPVAVRALQHRALGQLRRSLSSEAVTR